MNFCNQTIFLAIIGFFWPVMLISQPVDLFEIESSNGGYSLVFQSQTLLSEQTYFLSSINSVEVNKAGEKKIIVATEGSPGLVVFNAKGKAERTIGRFGKGPFEYQIPELVHVNDSIIYVWDSGKLKLNSYTLSGFNHLELSGFRWTVNDMQVAGDKLYLYNSGRSGREGFVQVYELNKVEPVHSYGDEMNETGRFFLMLNRSGGLEVTQNYIYYVTPHQLGLYRIDKHTGVESFFPVKDIEFSVPEIENAFEIVRKGSKEIEKYTAQSSSVFDLFRLDTFMVIATQIRKAEYSEQQKFYDYSNSKIKFYLLDENGNYVDRLELPVFTGKKILHGNWGTYGDRLYLLTRQNLMAETSKDELRLYEWKIQKNES